MTTVDQILVWPGSKRARASQLAGMFGDDARPVYSEPFLGSGSVYGCEIYARYGMAVLGDAAPRLIATYRAVRRDPAAVAAELARLPQSVAEGAALAVAMGLPAPADDKRAGRYAAPWKALFYDHRRRLNEWVPVRGETATPAHAAAFIWHRSAAFNGLVRTGPTGDNATAGDRVNLPTARSIAAFGAMLAGVTLTETDFGSTIRAAMALGAVDLFLDPPYAGDFSTYTADGYGAPERLRLSGLVREVVAAGGRVLVTEADHPDARVWLEAAGLHVRQVTGRTSISRGAGRGAKAELLARSWAW